MLTNLEARMVLAGLFCKELKCLRVVLATSAGLSRNSRAANVRLKNHT
jgi:hypothetical protein